MTFHIYTFILPQPYYRTSKNGKSIIDKYKLELIHTMSIEVRELENKDIGQVVDMWYELATMHEEAMNGYDLAEDPKDAWAEFIRNSREKKNMVTLIAEENDDVLGFVNVVIKKRAPFFAERRAGNILDLFVKEEERRKGVGTMLVKRAENWIKGQGVKLANMTVATVNEGAKGFWDGMGYEAYLEKRRKELSYQDDEKDDG